MTLLFSYLQQDSGQKLELNRIHDFISSSCFHLSKFSHYNIQHALRNQLESLWCQPIMTASLATDLKADKHKQASISATLILAAKYNRNENSFFSTNVAVVVFLRRSSHLQDASPEGSL